MIRAIRAIAWARWRVLLHSLRGTVRGDKLERLGRIAALLSPILYGVMLIPLCLGLSAGALVGGWEMAGQGGSIATVIGAARVLLGLVTAGVLLAPLVRSTQGLQFGIERLMLLPISRRVLHLSEFVGGMTDPWVLVVLPGLFLLPAGLALGGAPAAGLLVLLSGLLLVGTLGSLSAVCANGTTLLFRDRRRAEWVTLFFIVGIVLLALVPSYLDGRGTERDARRGAESSGATGGETRREFETHFGWAAGLPSELYAGSVSAATDGRTGRAVAGMAGLGVMGVFLFALSNSLHRRLLSGPERTSGRRPGEVARTGRWSLPGATPAVSAIALAQVRTTLRTVRGKIAVYFVVVMVIFIAIIFGHRILAGLPESWVVETGPVALLLGMLLTLVSLQPILMNQFAVDGPGLTLQFVIPVSNRELVRGKLLGCAILAGISLSLCAGGALLFQPGGSPWTWLAMILVCVSAFLLLAPLCSVTSAFLPKRSDLNRLGKRGDPHGFAGLIGMGLIPLSLAPPLTLYGIGLFGMGSPATASMLVAAWCVVALVAAWFLGRLAEWAVAGRRENLFLVAGEGG